MCFRTIVSVTICILFCVSCSQYRKIELVRSGDVRISLLIPEDIEVEEDVLEDEVEDVMVDESFLMNAVKDEETGEMIATDILSASSVTARFRNVAERTGYVTIGFDINVPAGMSDSKFRLKLYPEMMMQGDTVDLDPVIITGVKYREGQLRGYERYGRFLSSIVTDTTDFIRIGQLEIFLQRYFPDTYKMKSDSSLVSDLQAETLFGVTQEEALRHYTKRLRRFINERRIARKDAVFHKYVKDPIVNEGVRLDTVFHSDNGDFVYSYLHTFKSKPFLKKITVSVRGFLYADGEVVAQLPKQDELEFYISTLSSLINESPRHRMVVLERKAYDNTKAFLDFKVGSACVDTTLGDNALEMQRIRECINGVVAQKDFVLDSLLIVASCSPEGPWKYNDMLSEKRSNAMLEHIRDYVPKDLRDSLKTARIPENWDLLREMVGNDTLMSESEKRLIVRMIDGMIDPDMTERLLKRHPRYAYMKENLFPELRSVGFDFYLHRVGMVKDTIHTTELDTLYMSGLDALKKLDYHTAVKILGPYEDYNAALAYASLDRNHSAFEILSKLSQSDSKVCYLMAVVLSRLGKQKEAMKYYLLAESLDFSMRHRANLDPELSSLLKLNHLKN